MHYPNPFDPATTITYNLKKPAVVTLNIYDISGRPVRTLVNNEKTAAGEKSVKVNAKDLSSEVYFYTLDIYSRRIDSKKMVLIK
jgi:hypothetical protein